MSTHSSSAIHEPHSRVVTPQPAPETDSSIEARWASWLERGRQRDLAGKHKLRSVALWAASAGLLAAAFFGIAAGAR